MYHKLEMLERAFLTISNILSARYFSCFTPKPFLFVHPSVLGSNPPCGLQGAMALLQMSSRLCDGVLRCLENNKRNATLRRSQILLRKAKAMTLTSIALNQYISSTQN